MKAFLTFRKKGLTIPREKNDFCRTQVSIFNIVSCARNIAVKKPGHLREPQEFSRNGFVVYLLRERMATMEDKAFAPSFSAADLAITSKYWETVIRKNYFQPEKELMLAVLKDAVLTYKKCVYSGNTRFKEAEAWIFERDRNRLFSFESVCAMLGLSAGNIRKGLLAWRLNVLSDLACGGRQAHVHGSHRSNSERM